MKPNEQEIKEAYALKEALKSKSQFRPDYSRDKFEQMLKEQADSIKQSEYRSFTEMLQYIPEVRKRVPKSEQETAMRFFNEYNDSVSKSTLITIPVTFFAFCNKYMQNLIGKPGSFLLSIASTTVLTLTNIVFIQQVIHKEKLQRLQVICTQYKPIIRDPLNLEFIKFARSQKTLSPLLSDDRIADRAYQLGLEQLELKREGKFTHNVFVSYLDKFYALEREVNEESRLSYEKAQANLKQIMIRKEQRQQELERKQQEQKQQIEQAKQQK